MYPGIHAERSPDKPAVILAETGETLTYRQLNDDSIRIAKVLRELGLGHGDTYAILMGNSTEYFSVCWAGQRSGLYYVPLNWHLTAPELAYIVANSGAKAIIADVACAQQAEALAAELTVPVAALSLGCEIDGYRSIESFAAWHSTGDLPDEEEGSDMVYTSGTTGRPKGGRRQLLGVHPRDLPPEVFAFFALFELDNEDVRYLLPGAPLYHAAPLRFTMAITRIGGTDIVMNAFDPHVALQTIERYGVTHSQWVPTMFVRLLRLSESERRAHDLSTHRVAIHAAARCAVSVKSAMIDWWGPILHEYYGASEGGGVAYISPQSWLEHRGSVGQAIHGQFHILDDDGNELPAGQVGRIYASDAVPIEYLGDAEMTRRAYSREGWTTVGDLGYLDPDGFLYLAERRDDLIISGGVNIYPQEIEDVLIEHPAVADVAVIGIPNEEWGQEIKAVVQPLDDVVPTAELAEELTEFCRTRLAPYKIPRTIDFDRNLPRASSGKLYKRRLAERYWKDESAPQHP
ncbi:acyl-CoA synthetase [Nocardia sp. NBC_00508]|uniref:acyl-CoA synthetase n=1 Tax=Nocardia sp. NBC_00508 TaxID=2975992 RepID=UPI002E819CC1|nr:acyl-CoA synthetase [Nocardia sp. NBC_00508]WUD67114.1 acyl-CoA synthetase [Nocardia sp. NBC_00508]